MQPPQHGIEDSPTDLKLLLQRGLLTYTEDDRLQMHDQLRDMGRAMALEKISYVLVEHKVDGANFLEKILEDAKVWVLQCLDA